MMSNSRRRSVLLYLRDFETESNVRTLSEFVAAREDGVDISTVDGARRRNVHTSLYQTHLPRLVDAGLITYDQRSGRVTRGPYAAICDSFVELAERAEADPSVNMEDIQLEFKEELESLVPERRRKHHPDRLKYGLLIAGFGIFCFGSAVVGMLSDVSVFQITAFGLAPISVGIIMLAYMIYTQPDLQQHILPPL